MSLTRACLTVVFIAGMAQAGEPSWEQRQSIPKWAAASLESESFSAKYVVSSRLNPFLVQGDFNGDGRIDLAILVEQKESEASGVAIVHAGSEQPLVVGAGTPLGAGGGDFSWMDAWQIYSKGTVHQGAVSDQPPNLRGDALLVKKLEASSGIIYWDGSSYQWYQQGD